MMLVPQVTTRGQRLIGTHRSKTSGKFSLKLILFLTTCYFILSDRYWEKVKLDIEAKQNHDEIMRVLYFGCGSTYTEQVLMSVKSILFSHRNTTVNMEIAIYVNEDVNTENVTQVLDRWEHPKGIVTSVHTFHDKDVRFNKFRRCASTRLYMAELLPETWDKVIFLDADTIVQKDLSPLWGKFDDFSQETMFAINEEYGFLYTKPGSILGGGKYVPEGTTGFNSGVMLFDLEKMRASFEQRHQEVVQFAEQRDDVELAYYDQTVMVLTAFLHPDVYLLFDCSWNFRTDCRRHERCHSSERTAGILHGNGKAFIKHIRSNEEFIKRYNKVLNSTEIDKQ